MADRFWNAQTPSHPSSAMSSAHERQGYMSQHADQMAPRVINETNAIGSAYDRYLQNMQSSSFSSGEVSRLAGGGQKATDVGLAGPTFTDSIPMTRPGIAGVTLASNDLALGLGAMARSRHETLSFPLADSMPRSSHERLPLPADATSTLYVEGLSSGCKKREVAHIFRPFVGYKEVRLVVKDSKHRDGDALILCFVDFIDPACAATALSALQGYKMDEDDSDSAYLRIQFSKFPGPRSGSGNRGRR